jgi:hypothetical protein
MSFGTCNTDKFILVARAPLEVNFHSIMAQICLFAPKYSLPHFGLAEN